MAARAFLLPADLAAAVVKKVAAFGVDLKTVEPETIVFPEGGGTVDLEFAVPFLAGMDEVIVDSARLVLRAVDADLAINKWHTVAGPSGQGVFVVLDKPARLRRVVVDNSKQIAGTFAVIRAATLGANGAPAAGPPLFAGKDFSTGPMFPQPLAGLDVSVSSSRRLTLRVPATQGEAWLIQFATGDSPTGLTPSAVVPEATAVTVAPAASDVSLVLRGAGSADADLALWQHPGPLLTDAGDQLADFTPAAAQRLSAALESLNAGGGSATLSLPLRFQASTAGTLQIRDRSLAVRYVAHPAGTPPVELSLDGGWADLVLDAPVRPPSRSTLRLRARHRGTAVNAGSGVPPTRTPPGGVRVRTGRIVASSVGWQPAGSDSRPALAVVRLLGAPLGDTEIVCEARADAAGAPGPLVAGPLVQRLSGGSAPGWIQLPLPGSVPLLAPARLWVTVRTNRGELDWFSDGGDPEVRTSTDGGGSWGEIDAALGAPGRPYVQLLHTADPAVEPPPVLTVRRGETLLGTLPLTSTGRRGEYAEPTPAVLPAAVLAALSSPPGAGRRATTVSLWSPASLGLTVTELTCSYDPFAGA
jgi:hypothetical protein